MFRNALGLVGLVSFAVALCMGARAFAAPAPKATENIVLAGGCFWGVQAVFQHTKGVVTATSGYAGGKADTANYETVSGGSSGHAESVEVTYDPKQIKLAQLLDVYFTVAHNPTQLNYQGPDHGTQYRSAIFYHSHEQQKTVQAYIASLAANKKFSTPIVTTLEPLGTFYLAEDYHQNYATLHPYQPYIVIHDAPKLAALEKTLPQLYVK